jgi:hypothetical protein
MGAHMSFHGRAKSSFSCSLLGSLASVLLAASTGCSLIKINGKPLGGSSNSADASSNGADDFTDASTQGQPDRVIDAKRGKAPPPGLPSPTSPLCKLAHGDDGGTIAELEKGLATKDREYAAEALVEALCAASGQLAEQRGRVKKIGEAWMAKEHLDDRDVAVLFKMTKGRAEDVQSASELAGPVNQFGTVGGFEGLDRLGPAASMMARVSVVAGCFGVTTNTREVTSPDDAYPLLPSILCTRELIDLANAEAEIDATEGMNDHTRMRLRTVAWRASEVLRMAKAQMVALAKEDPGVAQLIAMADQQFKEWSSLSPQRVKLISQLAAMEQATATNKRSAFAGCEEQTVRAWSEHVSSLDLPQAPEKGQLDIYLNATLASPEGYLAFAALRLCSASEEDPSTKGEDVIPGMRFRRGPRTAAIASWLSLDKPIKFDDRNRKLSQLLNEMPGFGGGGGSARSTQAGVISKIEEIEGGVRVVFKTVRERRVTCANWVTTNQILRINSQGMLEYVQRCTSMAPVMMDVTAEPVEFGKAMAHGLKPGMFLVAIPGMPIVATRSPSSSKPLFVLGASVR